MKAVAREAIAARIEELDVLDPVSEPLQNAVRALVPQESELKDILSGTWLGHRSTTQLFISMRHRARDTGGTRLSPGSVPLRTLARNLSGGLELRPTLETLIELSGAAVRDPFPAGRGVVLAPSQTTV